MNLNKILKSSENSDFTYYITDNYSELIIKYANNPANMGRMNEPTASALIKGLCGNTMEIYLTVENNIIIEIKFYTDGCGVTLACGSAVTIMSEAKSIQEALSLSPRSIIEFLKGIPKAHLHCSILAISTLHKAIAEYLIKF